MKLLNELQERRRVLCEARDVMRADLLQTEAELYDLYRAIGALKPPPAAVTEPEIPEGFTKWQGGGFTEALHCKDVEVMFRDGRVLQGVSGAFTWSTAAELLANGWKHEDAEGGKIDAADDIIAYRIIEAAPQPEQTYTAQDFDTITIIEDPALTQDVIDALDDASEFSEEGYAPVIEAEPLADPIWNEPEPTKPEADALAKAADYYSPEAVAERNRFNPFGMFRKEGDQ